jgi:OmpA-OmpF porin, OOP family
MKRYLMASAIFLVLITSPCYAGVKAGSISAGFEDGWYVFDGQEDVTNTTQAGIWVGYDATKNIGIEAKLAYSGTLNNDETQKVRVWTYRAEGLYYFLPDSTFVPYGAVGVGCRSTRFTNDTMDVDAYVGGDRNYLTVDFGLGVKYFITDYLVARLDVRDVMLPSRYKEDFLNNIEATLGIGFYLSKKPKAAAPEPAAVAAPEPAPVVTPPPAPEPVPAPVVEPPAPAPVATEVEKKIVEKGMATLDVRFRTASAEIDTMYTKDLKSFADVMKKHPELKVYIEGHTDNIGPADYNKKLSQARAENVKKYLVEKLGVDGSKLTAIGYGEEKPIASNKTAEGRLKNRRVEAVVEYDKAKDVKK